MTPVRNWMVGDAGVCSRAFGARQYQEIAAALAEAISDGRLQPGMKLKERELSHLFRVSRAVVRQALLHLAAAKLVQSERGHSAAVARPDAAEILQLVDALAMLELAAMWRIARRSGRLPLHWNDVPGQQQTHAPPQAAARDQMFHSWLVSLGSDPPARRMYNHIQRRTYLAIAHRHYPISNDHFDEHVRLVELLRGGRFTRAAKLIPRHYERLALDLARIKPSLPSSAATETLATCLATRATGATRQD